MSNWGKAHENNSNGFGQASLNSDKGYGSVYDKSNSGDTVLNPKISFFALTLNSTETSGETQSDVLVINDKTLIIK